MINLVKPAAAPQNPYIFQLAAPQPETPEKPKVDALTKSVGEEENIVMDPIDALSS